MDEKGFIGLWIPIEILQDESLTLQEKLFLSRIIALDNKEGCFAGNTYFANLFRVSTRQASRVINSLVEKEYLSSEIIYKEGSKEILKRVLKFTSIPYGIKCLYPIDKNVVILPTGTSTPYRQNGYLPIDKNVADIKDIIKDINKESRGGSRFTPPTLEEVRFYCEERKNKIDPERFIDFYSSKGWMVGKNKMKDWKASVRSWEKREKESMEQNQGNSTTEQKKNDVLDKRKKMAGYEEGGTNTAFVLPEGVSSVEEWEKIKAERSR